MVGFYGGILSGIEMIKVIHTANEQGVTLFDTTESYGLLYYTSCRPFR